MDLEKEYKAFALKNLTKQQASKLVGKPEAGKTLHIDWEDETTDWGYLFELPMCDITLDYDFFVHVPNPDNSQGIGDAPPVWQHLNNLLSNKMVKKITIRTF